MGFIVTKRQFGRRAVDRNRARRRVKESARAELLRASTMSSDSYMRPGYWYIVVCKRACLSASYEELCHSWRLVRDSKWRSKTNKIRNQNSERHESQRGLGKKQAGTQHKKRRKLSKMSINDRELKLARGDMKKLRRIQRRAVRKRFQIVLNEL